MFFGGVMAVSWVQYAYGIFNGDVNTGEFYTVGPLRGPAVITEVRCAVSLNQFSSFVLGASIVRSSAATLENFNSGVKLGSPPAESSVASTDVFWSFSASGSNPFEIFMPCFVAFGAEPRWVCLFGDRIGGAGNLRTYTSVRAERLWPDAGGVIPSVTGEQRPGGSALEGLRARARSFRSSGRCWDVGSGSNGARGR